MTILAIQFFSIEDLILVPICVLVLYGILRSRTSNLQDENLKRIYYKGFYFKVACVLVYTFVTEFYFGGGDTGLYYQGVKNFRTALTADYDLLGTIFTTSHLTDTSPLTPYFLYDNYANDFTYGYMTAPSNFIIPQLALIPSLLFANNYLCISLFFSFFALAGSLRLFKIFYHFYPDARTELALAAVFLPSVGFWSGGLLKDTICFGCVGFLLYGFFNIFIRKKQVFWSVFWILVSGFLLYTIKTYIFLVLMMAITIWIFAETNKLIREPSLRIGFGGITFLVSLVVCYLLFTYFTSAETLRQYQIENIVSTADYQRSNYEQIDRMQSEGSAYYSINASNPVLLVINSIGATFFRPFPWEVRSAAALLSAIEALLFLLLTLHLMIKKGLLVFFRQIFRDPRVIMCFIFAIVFAIGIGASTANFGALSRYKIPCMPFYLIMLILMYRYAEQSYPKWFNRILALLKL